MQTLAVQTSKLIRKSDHRKQHSREVIKRRYAPGAPAERDMLGAFKAHGISAEHAETEISISLYVLVFFHLSQT